MGNAVETWLDSLSPENHALIDRLRGIVAAAAPGLDEAIKWNAPSFSDGDQDRVTLGLERKGGVRVVLHRGAAVKDTAGFAFEDSSEVARWPSADRGVATFADLKALEARAADLEDLIRRWVAANRQA